MFFDVAHTLLHKPGIFVAIQQELQKRGVEIDLQAIRRHHRIVSEVTTIPDVTSRAFYRGFNSRLLASMGIDPEPAMVEKIYERSTELEWQPYDDTSAISGLSAPLGVISNWDSHLPELIRIHFRVAFRYVFGSHGRKHRKPDPQFYEDIIHELGCEPGDILFVGDSPILDIIPANSIGIKGVLIDRDDCFPYSTLLRIRSLYELRQLMVQQ